MGDLFDVINYCAISFAMGKLSVYDKIVIRNQKKRKDRYQKYFT